MGIASDREHEVRLPGSPDSAGAARRHVRALLHQCGRAEWADAADYLASIARPGDLMVTMSCGSVYRIIPQILEALASKASN